MKIHFEYGRSVFCLPSIPESLILRAGKTDLRLLLTLASDSSLCENFDERADGLAEEFGTTRAAIDGALGFWIGAGVLSMEKGDAPSRPAVAVKAEKPALREAEPAEKIEKRTRVTELPQYTSEEFTRVMERRAELSELIDEAQRELGKVFNMTETQLLVSIIEGLGVDDGYVLSLLAYCKRIGKANLRYVEKTACSLYDKGVCTASQLEEYLKGLDMVASSEGQIRRIFGIGDRAFTSKESKCINDWINTFGFDFEMIKCAYEETVNATSKPSMSYANKVLENWYAEGYKTPDDVKKAKEKRNGSAPSAQATSFNVDDFFDAAIKKGFGEGQGG